LLLVLKYIVKFFSEGYYQADCSSIWLTKFSNKAQLCAEWKVFYKTGSKANNDNYIQISFQQNEQAKITTLSFLNSFIFLNKDKGSILG